MVASFITTTQAAERAGISARRVQQLCKAGEIKGAQQFGGVWMVPASWKWKPGKPGPKGPRRLA